MQCTQSLFIIVRNTRSPCLCRELREDNVLAASNVVASSCLDRLVTRVGFWRIKTGIGGQLSDNALPLRQARLRSLASKPDEPLTTSRFWCCPTISHSPHHTTTTLRPTPTYKSTSLDTLTYTDARSDPCVRSNLLYYPNFEVLDISRGGGSVPQIVGSPEGGMLHRLALNIPLSGQDDLSNVCEWGSS